MPPYLYRHNRLRLLLIFFAACLFVAFFLFRILRAGNPIGFHHSEILLFTLDWICGGFFLLGMLVTIQQIFSRQAALLLTENGFIDRSSALAAGFLMNWREVNQIYLTQISGQTLLSVTLHDDSAFFARLPRRKRFFAKLNSKLGFAPISIVIHGTDMAEVKAQMQHYRDHFQKNQQKAV